jgi:asparagine synthase (glutamine-hydrolysing)
MCGIAGAYQQTDGRSVVSVMGERLAHRGPDDAGQYSYADERIDAHLAHRRLSIIDLEGGHQPLVKGGLALCYNGELYNYRQLRVELAREGARFSTSSDTEVVLEAWRRWGPACLRRFRGMFAFALLDELSGSLFLARDHLGIKPLYYLRRKDGVVFSSELKALVEAFGEELSMDPTALVASILYYWVPDRRCSIQGVEKVQPGTWAEFRPDGSFRVASYWDIAEVAARAAEAGGGSATGLREVIETSVAAHLVADVPVSSFLSGGLDSSIVTVLAKRTQHDLDAYTITFRPEDERLEAMPDDASYARRLARHHGIELHEIEIAPQVVELLPRMVEVLDEPIGDPAAINTLLMCEAARQAGVKVILSGMGADELFGGYRKHRACVMAARYRNLPAGLRGATRTLIGHLPVVFAGRGLRHARWAKRFLTFCELPEAEAFRRSYSLYDASELSALLSPDLGPAIDQVIDEQVETYDDNSLGDHANRMCLADARLFLPGLNLTYTDRASMAASTEVRVPFVDPVVFEAAFSLAGCDKVRARSGKAALKDAARAWLPSEIVDRPKASFSAPLRSWVSKDLRRTVDEALVGGELAASGFLQRKALTDMMEQDRSGKEDRSKQIWQLLSLELWYRQARRAGVALP